MSTVVKKKKYANRFTLESILWWLCLKHMDTMNGIMVNSSVPHNIHVHSGLLGQSFAG